MSKYKKTSEKMKIKGRFVPIANCFLNCEYIDKRYRVAKLVYLFIASSGGAYGEARGVPVKKIARNLAMSTDFVSECTGYLCHLGLLEKASRDRNGIITYFLPVQRLSTIKDVAEKNVAAKGVFTPKEKKDLFKTQIPTKFVLNHKLPQFIRIIGSTILSIVKGNKSLSIDIDYISKLSGFSERHVSRAVTYLKEHGYINVINRKYKSGVFFIKEKFIGGNNYDFIKGKYRQSKGKAYKNNTPAETPEVIAGLERWVKYPSTIAVKKQMLESEKIFKEIGLDPYDIALPFINEKDYEFYCVLEVAGRVFGTIDEPLGNEAKEEELAFRKKQMAKR